MFKEKQLEFGKDITEKCLRIFSRRGNWNFVKTLLKNVLREFRLGELGQLTVGKRMNKVRECGVFIPCYIAIE